MNIHGDPKIEAAVRSTWQSHPYYASAIGRLRIIPDSKVDTMSTSASWVTHYNPATVATWTVDETAAVLVHEVEHLLRRHHTRCGTRDPGRFNRAADAEINERLAGLPEGAIYPETLGMPRGRTAEVYYNATGDGDSKPDPQPGEPGEPGDGSGEGSGSTMPGDGAPAQCGSAAGGPTQPHEAGDAANPGAGADPDAADAARKEAAQGILGSVGRGTDPGEELREWAETELGIDRAAWYTALASVVGHTLSPFGAPTRWQWPGRRDPRDIGGAMLPRWTGERPSCAVVIDTSGSITPYDLGMARAAGHYIGRVADAVYYGCNTRATRYGSTMPERIVGGGGTDLRAGIAMAIAEGAKAIVVITDCDTPWPWIDPGVPVIIGANPSAGTNPTVPEWMRVIPVVGTHA